MSNDTIKVMFRSRNDIVRVERQHEFYTVLVKNDGEWLHKQTYTTYATALVNAIAWCEIAGEELPLSEPRKGKL